MKDKELMDEIEVGEEFLDLNLKNALSGRALGSAPEPEPTNSQEEELNQCKSKNSKVQN